MQQNLMFSGLNNNNIHYQVIEEEEMKAGMIDSFKYGRAG